MTEQKQQKESQLVFLGVNDHGDAMIANRSKMKELGIEAGSLRGHFNDARLRGGTAMTMKMLENRIADLTKALGAEDPNITVLNQARNAVEAQKKTGPKPKPLALG